jgi:hypothetical protein
VLEVLFRFCFSFILLLLQIYTSLFETFALWPRDLWLLLGSSWVRRKRHPHRVLALITYMCRWAVKQQNKQKTPVGTRLFCMTGANAPYAADDVIALSCFTARSLSQLPLCILISFCRISVETACDKLLHCHGCNLQAVLQCACQRHFLWWHSILIACRPVSWQNVHYCCFLLAVP